MYQRVDLLGIKNAFCTYFKIFFNFAFAEKLDCVTFDMVKSLLTACATSSGEIR